MDTILEIRNLVKCYPGVTAVDGISFSIRPGICFGLLGPNGAGKTTTIEITEGIIAPTSGEILYKGAPRTADFHEEIGIQFQSTSLLAFLSVRESLETFHRLYQNPMHLDDLIAICQLEDILDRYNDKISGGQKQRLLLAMALVNDPDLVFLDEPTTGLDPQARRHLWDIVEEIRAKGKTVVLTTHYMEEAEMLCEEIAIIDKGKIIAQGAPDDLLREYCSGVTISLPKGDLSDRLFSSEDTDTSSAWKLFETQKRYELQTKHVNECLNFLLSAGADLSHVNVRSQNLEDLFLKLTGKQLRQ